MTSNIFWPAVILVLRGNLNLHNIKVAVVDYLLEINRYIFKRVVLLYTKFIFSLHQSISYVRLVPFNALQFTQLIAREPVQGVIG